MSENVKLLREIIGFSNGKISSDLFIFYNILFVFLPFLIIFMKCLFVC